jgi:transcription initiation factor TFIIIB Brf1 subunit/transcription initiation factor TFIIB
VVPLFAVCVSVAILVQVPLSPDATHPKCVCVCAPMKLVYDEKKICKDCNDPDAIVVDKSAGDVICTKCGIVLQERCLDVGMEWRNFVNDGVGGESLERGDYNDSYVPDEDCRGGGGTCVLGAGGEAKMLNRAIRKAERCSATISDKHMRCFVVTNAEAQLQKTVGVGVRRTMKERDVDETRTTIKWGDTVRGRTIGQWLLLGDSSGYLPINLNNKRILFEVLVAETTTTNAMMMMMGPTSRHWGGGLPPPPPLPPAEPSSSCCLKQQQQQQQRPPPQVIEELLKKIAFSMTLGDGVTVRCIDFVKLLAKREKLPKKNELAWTCALVHLATIEENCKKDILEIAQAIKKSARTRSLQDGTKSIQKEEPMEKSGGGGRTLQSEKFQRMISGHVKDLTNILGLARPLENDDVLNIVRTLNLPHDVADPAQHIAQKALELQRTMSKKLPSASIIAAAIFVVAYLLDVTRKPGIKEIAAHARCSQPQMKAAYNKTFSMIQLLIPKTLIIKLPEGLAGLPASL